MAQANWMQERQDEGTTEFIIRGVDDWQSCLAAPVKLDELYTRLCGANEIPHIDYARKEAEMNNQSFERSVFVAFVRLGYQLEELEVEIENKAAAGWGRCVWYKDHDAYKQLLPDIWKDSGLEPQLFYAMWKTENAGDQHYGIYSTQMSFGGWLPHKTLIYRKVVFSPPAKSEQAAA